MSPTVLDKRGYRFVIYLNDHPPAHVHVRKAEKDARVRLDPVEILHNFGFTRRELREIIDRVTEHQGALLAEWDIIHPER